VSLIERAVARHKRAKQQVEKERERRLAESPAGRCDTQPVDAPAQSEHSSASLEGAESASHERAPPASDATSNAENANRTARRDLLLGAVSAAKREVGDGLRSRQSAHRDPGDEPSVADAPPRWHDRPPGDRVDLKTLEARGYLTPSTRSGPLAEEFRRIKRPLLTASKIAIAEAGGEPGGANVIVVTSAVPGEGKTFVSINLAMSICSDVDHSVLLIDGDPRRSQIADRLGLVRTNGLLEVLAGECALEDAIVTTDVPKLSVLPSGCRSAGAEELFASAQMRELLSEMSARYPERMLIIDAPPLLAASEALVLSRLAGLVVLVVGADSTPEPDVRGAIEMVDDCDSVSLLLNKASRSLGGAFQHYDYDY
jgi:exopolysaccharide/PEP-CTERM locus tyrosine autokinase